MTVSIASDTRLRKLRDFEGEDAISGKEYMRRLKRQFELLNPPPEWARQARKARAESDLAENRDSADEDEDVEMDEDISAQPLAAILRSSKPLTVQRDINGTKIGKLKPEVLDIQRLKDIGETQMVWSFFLICSIHR
jgi:U3 small nucleolar RNA-associated protein 18